MGAIKKMRLDLLLVERGLEETRQRAQAVIMSGQVYVAGRRVDKPGTAVAEDAAVEIRGNTLRYVSRGGLKLEKAMEVFRFTRSEVGGYANIGLFCDFRKSSGLRARRGWPRASAVVQREP